MDEKTWHVLERNSGLLVGNMVLSEEFFRLLKTEHVLPDTMVRDIQSLKTQHSRNTRLLETLRLRGGDAYRKFRQVLLLTGHQLLADHLHGEDTETRLLRAEEVFARFPRVFQHVSDDVKTRMLKYFETKVKEKAVTNAWLTSSAERCDVMESRRAAFDTEKDYKIKLETKSKKLAQANNEILRLTEELQKREEEIGRIHREIGQMRTNFKEDLATQSRFNAANNSSIILLKDRFDNFNERVKTINVAIRRFLEPENVSIDDDADNVKLSMLEKNVRKLIQCARINLENTSTSISEKEAVLKILKTSSRERSQTLADVVQQYVEKQEKMKISIWKEIEHLLDVLRGKKYTAKVSTKPKTELKQMKSQIALLREEVEHIKKKLDWKDAQISDLIKENHELKEQTLRPTTQQKTASIQRITSSSDAPDVSCDTPDSAKEIEKVYQQFKRYTTDTPTSPVARPFRRGSLADVNLEHDFSTPPPELKLRRNSNYDSSGLDILGTTNQYRRSITELQSLEGFGDLKKLHSNALNRTIDTVLPNVDTGSTVSQTSVDKFAPRRRETPSDTLRSGRRPSLAELITIYENSQDNAHDQEEDIVTSRLPLLQET